MHVMQMQNDLHALLEEVEQMGMNSGQSAVSISVRDDATDVDLGGALRDHPDNVVSLFIGLKFGAES